MKHHPPRFSRDQQKQRADPRHGPIVARDTQITRPVIIPPAASSSLTRYQVEGGVARSVIDVIKITNMLLRYEHLAWLVAGNCFDPKMSLELLVFAPTTQVVAPDEQIPCVTTLVSMPCPAAPFRVSISLQTSCYPRVVFAHLCGRRLHPVFVRTLSVSLPFRRLGSAPGKDPVESLIANSTDC